MYMCAEAVHVCWHVCWHGIWASAGSGMQDCVGFQVVLPPVRQEEAWAGLHRGVRGRQEWVSLVACLSPLPPCSTSAGTAGKGLYRPVGLGATANLGIPDSSFTASGQSDDQTGPEQARLYSASYGGGWVGMLCDSIRHFTLARRGVPSQKSH